MYILVAFSNESWKLDMAECCWGCFKAKLYCTTKDSYLVIRLGSRSAHEMGHVPHSESLCSSNQQLKEVGCWALTIVGNAVVLIHIIKTLMEVGSGY